MAQVMWEYRVIPITGEVAEGGAEALEPLLDELGGDGWELVAVDSSSGSTLYVFKRRLAAAVAEEGDEYEDDEDYDEDDEYDEDGTIRIGPSSGRR